MLPRARRLTTREFAAAFEKNRVLRHPLLHLRVHERGAKTPMRAAFVVPKKLGGAVFRNRTRRRVRERFRLQMPHHEAALSGCDLIFLATAQADKASSAQLDEALEFLLRRAKPQVRAAREDTNQAARRERLTSAARLLHHDEQPERGA